MKKITRNLGKMSLTSNIRGSLEVTIVSAKNFEKCDPYFKLTVDDLHTKSATKRSCTEGTWNQRLTLDLDGSQDSFLLELWDYDTWTSDDLVDTTGVLQLQTVIQEWTSDQTWVTMKNGAKVCLSVKLLSAQHC